MIQAKTKAQELIERLQSLVSDPNEFQLRAAERDAKALLQHNAHEAYVILGIIYAIYYCAYHTCTAKYQANLPANRKPTGMHMGLIESLRRSSDRKERQIGFILGDIYEQRLFADYKLNQNMLSQDVQHAITQTNRLLELLTDD